MKFVLYPAGPGLSLESVVATDELAWRTSRPPDHEAESRALVALAQEMASEPEDILQKLVEQLLALCHADSAGISIREEKDGQEAFRWHALAGRYAAHRRTTTPRHFSPSGLAIARNELLLLSRPALHFTYLEQLAPPIVEALLCPLAVGGELVGTLWVMSNDDLRRFDSEDARMLRSLAKFAAAAYQMTLSSEAIRQADRRKDEFLAVLAHELRNPLAPMQNAVHYLRQRGMVQPDERKAIDMLGRQVQSMTRMIDDLLDISRISRDKLELRKQRIDVASFVQLALETSRPFIDLCGHELVVTLPAQPVRLDGDTTRLAQVVANMLNNSAKYTRDGGRIELAVEEAHGEIAIRIRDNGVGIAADMLSRIFDPFAQVDSSLERSRGGLGIGLALVRRLVKMHGGTVEANSAGLGQGSEFVIRLPAAPQLVGEGRMPLPEAEPPARAVAALRILVVDDNRDAANSLAMLLRLDGYEVLTAYDGPSALQVAADTRPEVILQDLGMPGMSGYEVARRLNGQSTFDSTAIVALSGYGTAEDRQRSSEAGFHDHLVKPVDLALLRKLLGEQCERVAIRARPETPQMALGPIG